MSLTTRYVLAFTGLIVLACGSVGAAVVFGNLTYAERVLQDNAVLTAALMAELSDDDAQSAVRLAVDRTPDDVYAAALYDADLNVVAKAVEQNHEATFPDLALLRELSSSTRPADDPAAVVQDGTTIALVAVDHPTVKFAVVVLSATAALENLGDSVWFAIVVVVIFAVLASVGAVVIARRVTRPVQALVRATADLETLTFDPATLSTQRRLSGELGSLTTRFSEMAETVQARQLRMASELDALQVTIDPAERRRSVDTITSSPGFADLEQRAAAGRERRAQQERKGPR